MTNNNNNDTNTKEVQIFFLIFSILLMVILFLSKFLHDRPKLRSILSEPAMTLLVGMFFSFLVNMFFVVEDEDEDEDEDDYYDYYDNDNDNDNAVQQQDDLANSILSFQTKIFFMALLPPILFNSGYELQRELFYRHFKTIALFACLGTCISGMATGGVLYLARQLNWFGGAADTSTSTSTSFDPTILELFTFGALIAATDTVSVVGILQTKQVDPHLFSLVFGESALNDAVAIVLFKTLSDFLVMAAEQEDVALDDDDDDDDGDGDGDDDAHRALLIRSILKYAGNLLVQAVGSPLVGALFAFAMGLAFKHVDLRKHHLLELALYILPMYIPFILSEVLSLSGMITVFFTGIFAKRYMEPNVSKLTKQHAQVLFRLFAFLAETCIFLELGLSVFGGGGGGFSGGGGSSSSSNYFQQHDWQFIGWALFAALFGRALSIYPLAFLLNMSLTRIVKVCSISSMCADDTSIITMESNNNNNNNNIIINAAVERGAPEEGSSSSIQGCGGFSGGGCCCCGGGGGTTIIIRNDLSSAGAAAAITAAAAAAASTSNCSYTTTTTTSTTTTTTTMATRLETPERKRDKRIPTNFMHFLWFAGLRGAVAYACAREFPDVYGHRNEFVAATMVIVLVTIILMGGATAPLMDRLQIRTNVNEKEYMRQWRRQRRLKGRFHRFEYNYIYRFVVRQQDEREEEQALVGNKKIPAIERCTTEVRGNNTIPKMIRRGNSSLSYSVPTTINNNIGEDVRPRPHDDAQMDISGGVLSDIGLFGYIPHHLHSNDMMSPSSFASRASGSTFETAFDYANATDVYSNSNCNNSNNNNGDYYFAGPSPAISSVMIPIIINHNTTSSSSNIDSPTAAMDDASSVLAYAPNEEDDVSLMDLTYGATCHANSSQL